MEIGGQCFLKLSHSFCSVLGSPSSAYLPYLMPVSIPARSNYNLCFTLLGIILLGKKKNKIFDMFALSCASLHLSSFLWKTSHITILQEGFKLSGGLHLGTENAGSFHFKNTICLTQMYIISMLLSFGVHIRRINLSCT